jgi:DNA-binding response OmpR family regulator
MQILKSLNILYAEDSRTIRESISITLKMFFGNVFVASDGAEALEVFNKNKIDVVMLDYVMPKLDGHDVAKKIRKLNKKIPIVIASAYTDKEKLLKAIELNLVKYIEKPILHEDLINIFGIIVDILNENNMLLVHIDNYTVYDSISKKIILEDKTEHQLTKNEVSFLELLLSKPNQLFTKEVIEECVFQSYVDENTLRNMVYRLRKKLNSNSIVTIKDFGYLIKI